MNRKDFFNSMGMGVASLALLNCVGGCAKSADSPSSDVSGASSVDFTLDLGAPANATLLTNGGYLVSNGVLLARTMAGAYITVQRSCTHENYTLTYQGGSSRFYCANHGATFSESGSVSKGPASKSLTTYKTTVTGTSLRVYS